MSAPESDRDDQSERSNDADGHGTTSEEPSENEESEKRGAEEERLRKELGRQEGQFRLLVQEVKEYAIFRLDPEGYIQSWNAGAERIKGYTEEEILGRHFSTFYTEADIKAGRPETGLEGALQDGQWTDEGWRVRKDGSRFWARVTITALTGEDGELRGFAKVTRDMTERKQHEEALAEEKRKAEQKNALLRLMQRVASAANEAETFEDALQDAVNAICEQTGWPIGHVYLRTDDAEAEEPDGKTSEANKAMLEPSGIWNRGSRGQFDRFRAITEKLSAARGEGLPGRVLQTNKPVWIEDVTEEAQFARAKVATDINVKGAFAFPVSLEEEPKAVLELFSEEAEAPNPELLDAMKSVGVQLSRVAEREQAIHALAFSEERYRRLFEDAQEGIAISTLDGSIAAVNPAAAEIFGYSREELRSMETKELYADPEEQEEAAKELEEKGGFKGKELRLRRGNGEEIVCRLSTSIRYDEDERPVAFMTFFRDVTERKRAQEALKESEEMFRKLAENALVGIGMTQEGTYAYANPALADITGYSREELLEKTLQDLVHPDDWPKVQKMRTKRLSGEEFETPNEMRIQTKSGETRLVEVAGSLITYQGTPTVIGTMQDITERRRLQREVLSVQEEERKRLGQDLHDGVASQLTGATLKLNILSGKTEEENPSINESLQEIQALIEESAGDVRRLSRGLNPGGLSEGNLPSALEGLVSNTEGARLETEEAWEQDFNLDTDALASDREVATHLYRIAQEAVANARRHGAAEEIVIRLELTDDALVLEVEDDGTGFDPSDVSEEGLGLRSMRHRAELLGADLTVESSPEEGTLVCCHLPV